MPLALYSVSAVAGGTVATTTACTVAAATFLGAGTVMYGAVLMADYSSVDSFYDSADWGTVGYTAGGAVLGAGYGYVLDKSMRPVVEGSRNTVTETSKLLDARPELIGTNREKLLSTIQNQKLNDVANQLYRPGPTTGDGGSASKLMDEFISGDFTHLLKAQERLTQLNNIAKNEVLNLNDWDILEALRYDLEQAINLFK